MIGQIRRYLSGAFDDGPSATPPLFDAEKDRPFVLPATVTCSGDLVIEGDLIMEHVQDGVVEATRIYIAQTADIEGTVIATVVDVAGRVNGVIYADRIVLRSSCIVEGELIFREIVLEQGAYFEGKARKEPNPHQLAKKVPRRVIRVRYDPADDELVINLNSQ